MCLFIGWKVNLNKYLDICVDIYRYLCVLSVLCNVKWPFIQRISFYTALLPGRWGLVRAGEGGQTLFVSHRQTVGAEAGVQTCKRCLRVLGIENTSTCTCTIKTLSINNLLKANHTNKIQPQWKLALDWNCFHCNNMSTQVLALLRIFDEAFSENCPNHF